MVAAVRELFGNPTAPLTKHTWPLEHPVAAAFMACAVMLAVAVPASLRPHQRLT